MTSRSNRNFLSYEELDELMNQPSDEEDEVTKEIQNAISINVVALPPPVDNLSDCEDIDDDRVEQFGEKPTDEIAGEVELQWKQQMKQWK